MSSPDVVEVQNAGFSVCPVCQIKWLVTPMNDCMLPECGCFGHDTSAANLRRPCENCGTIHAFTCNKMKLADRKEEREK